MDLHPLPADEAAVRRFSEELWLPYHRTLEAVVDSHALVDAPDDQIVDAEVEFRLGRLADDHYRLWVAVDGVSENVDLAAGDGELAGFVATGVDEAPPVFDRPNRLVVGDIYVREAYRGSGLARELLARAAERARDVGCAEMTLEVDVDNERALAFYEKFGFEPLRHQLVVDTDRL
ncbi:GNAT family N-acetyltransferase [Halogranum rubrum]|uniref:GCN5-like N-acetyltransferase n=1 Tax=Halogranum salarium B-1 TaxID=1210908 RepID=J2ZZU3_9EURY|nr:GNAT family N-acetyltransferase [Halogranum salarium]EJN58568.1 GCN5-like N-acetyltransferase [Halogranum salarium B-1]